MTNSKYDETLQLIAKNESLYKLPESYLDEEILKDLVQEGLIKKKGEGKFDLTGYGEIIEVMGYHSHKKQKEETKPAGKEKGTYNWIYLLLIFLLLITALFFLFFLVSFFSF